MGIQDVDRELTMMIGARLRMARKLKDITQIQLADRLGITFQQVQKYEVGKNRISASMLIRAAEFLEQPITFFTNPESK